MTTTDRYAVGDKVFFRDFGEFSENEPFADIARNHAAHFGKGPYEIQDIEDSAQATHPQILMVNGERYSGWWFDPK